MDASRPAEANQTLWVAIAGARHDLRCANQVQKCTSQFDPSLVAFSCRHVSSFAFVDHNRLWLRNKVVCIRNCIIDAVHQVQHTCKLVLDDTSSIRTGHCRGVEKKS